jgi:predicted nucleic acid-binding protein
VSSVVGEIELRRAGRRFRASEAAIDAIVATISLVQIDDEVRLLAATVGSASLRSLDAIHLATAISLGGDLGAFCCYDRRLAADAEAAGLTVVSPGLD